MPLPRPLRLLPVLVLPALLAAGCGSSGGDTPDTTVAAAADTSAAAGTTAAVSPVSDGASWYSCAPSQPFAGLQPVAAGTRLKVATTVAPITSIVSNVAGGLADVEGIVPEGTNSHTFEPKPSVATLLSQANLVIVNGLKLEEPTRDLAEANAAAGSAIVELGTRTITPEQELYDFSFPKEGGKPNPHLWTNPPMAACYARISADALKAADPANADAYEANATAYIAKLQQVDAAFRTASDTVPAGNRQLLTYHDAYAYFAQTYGWTVIGAIQVSDFEEPTPREVADLIKQVKDVGVPAIFGSEVFPSPVLEQIGKEAGVALRRRAARRRPARRTPGDPQHSLLGLHALRLLDHDQGAGRRPRRPRRPGRSRTPPTTNGGRTPSEPAPELTTLVSTLVTLRRRGRARTTVPRSWTTSTSRYVPFTSSVSSARPALGQEHACSKPCYGGIKPMSTATVHRASTGCASATCPRSRPSTGTSRSPWPTCLLMARRIASDGSPWKQRRTEQRDDRRSCSNASASAASAVATSAQLSGGQQQRVFLARALLMRIPQLLLMDEPTSGRRREAPDTRSSTCCRTSTREGRHHRSSARTTSTAWRPTCPNVVCLNRTVIAGQATPCEVITTRPCWRRTYGARMDVLVHAHGHARRRRPHDPPCTFGMNPFEHEHVDHRSGRTVLSSAFFRNGP